MLDAPVISGDHQGHCGDGPKEGDQHLRIISPSVRQVSKLLTKVARGSRHLSHAGRRTPHYPAMARRAWHFDTNHCFHACRWAGCRPPPSATRRCLRARGNVVVERGQHALCKTRKGWREVSAPPCQPSTGIARASHESAWAGGDRSWERDAEHA